MHICILHRSLEFCKWHAPSQSSQPSCLRFTATSLDDIGWSSPDWSPALFSTCLVNFRTVNDLDFVSDLCQPLILTLGFGTFSRYRKRSHPYKFWGTVFVVNLHHLWNCMFSRAWLIHWLSRDLCRAILLAFSVDPGVRNLKDAEASCFALHTLCSCSTMEAASLADARIIPYLLFAPENVCGRTTSLPILHSNTEYEFLQMPVSRQSNVVRRRGIWTYDSLLRSVIPLNLPKC